MINYQLNVEKSDGTTEIISIEIPLKAGTYDVKYTLGTGNAISAGTIVVNETENTYNLNITLSDNEVKTVQIKTPVALTFANATWEQIDEICRTSQLNDYFAGYATKDLTLNNGTVLRLSILSSGRQTIDGVECDRLAIGMIDFAGFGWSEDAIGSDGSEDLSDYVDGIFENLIPQDLKNVIKTTTVYYSDRHSTQEHPEYFHLVPYCCRNFPPLVNYIDTPTRTYNGEQMRYPPSTIYSGNLLVLDRGSFRNSLTGVQQVRYGYSDGTHVVLNPSYTAGEVRAVAFYFNI